MNSAVAIVQAYLRLNGYFTVTEFPVVEAMRSGGLRVATDLDVLAFRFPGAARIVPRQGAGASRDQALGGPDPALGLERDEADMIVAEVKEGRAELNRGARDPAVLRAALTRFGCCGHDDAEAVVGALIRKGEAQIPGGHRVRLVAFGTSAEEGRHGFQIVLLGHVIRYVAEYLRDHWDALHHAEFKDPALGLIAAFIKGGVRWESP